MGIIHPSHWQSKCGNCSVCKKVRLKLVIFNPISPPFGKLINSIVNKLGMSNKKLQDVIVILGGGRYNDGALTPLSIQRLEKGLELYKNRKAPKIITLGGFYSTYSPHAIKFDKTGAQLRKEYLISRGVNQKDTIKFEDGRDTICEAFASRIAVRKLKMKKILLVTSNKHLKRALWIFRRIFGEKFEIQGEPVPCGDLLVQNEEKEYLETTIGYFKNFPENIPDPNFKTWFKENKKLYEKFKQTHDRYHPPGELPSQAYLGIRKG